MLKGFLVTQSLNGRVLIELCGPSGTELQGSLKPSCKDLLKLSYMTPLKQSCKALLKLSYMAPLKLSLLGCQVFKEPSCMAPLKLSYMAPWLLGLLGLSSSLRTELHGPFETELRGPFETKLHGSLAT